MLDHITLTVRDYELSKSFYTNTLSPIGMKALYEEDGTVIGFGVDRPFFWIGAHDNDHPASTNIHVAFQCNNKEAVASFHEAALAAGGKDNGAPGPRPQYHENYFAAFVLDPDGNNIEVVFGNS